MWSGMHKKKIGPKKAPNPVVPKSAPNEDTTAEGTPKSAPKKKRAPRKSYDDPSFGSSRKKSANKRKKRNQSSDDESSGTEYPDWIKNLKDPVLAKEDFISYLSKAVKNQSAFDGSLNCSGCNESFPIAMHSVPQMVLSEEYVIHCLEKCAKFPRNQIKYCNICFHKFLSDSELRKHPCSKLKKEVYETLKYKMPWNDRNLYLQLLDNSKASKNSLIYCKGCQTEFKCHQEVVGAKKSRKRKRRKSAPKSFASGGSGKEIKPKDSDSDEEEEEKIGANSGKQMISIKESNDEEEDKLRTLEFWTHCMECKDYKALGEIYCCYTNNE